MRLRTIGRIFGVLAGMVVATWLAYSFEAHWYVALPSGAAVYLIIRYLFWAVNEHRDFKADMEQMIEKAKRGEPFD